MAAAANATTKFIAGHSATEAGGALLSRILPEIVAGPAVEALGFAAGAPVALAAAFVIGGIELYEHRKEIWDTTRHGPLEGQTIQDQFQHTKHFPEVADRYLHKSHLTQTSKSDMCRE